MHGYQTHGWNHVIENNGAGLFLDMGLGKTIITLSAANELKYDYCEIRKILVVAPKKVVEMGTWTNESAKWSHVKHLRFSVVLGNERKRKEALKAKADVYVINRDNIAWLTTLYGNAWPFDMVILDELSSFKNPSSLRFKSLRKVRPFIKRLVGLTGTPSPNGLIDLWSQVWLLDMGDRLGKTITNYRKVYFSEGRGNGQVVFNYDIRSGSDKLIQDAIKDICISMSSEDYLELPERIDRYIPVNLSSVQLAGYEEFTKNLILSLGDTEITAINAASLTNKLLQYANGAIYDEDRGVHEIHSEKLDALEEIVDVANSPVLIFYRYQHDYTRIMKRLRAYNPRKLVTEKDQRDWNEGKCHVMLAHPASAAYGLNLQDGGNNVVWFGETWSLELYMQANSRIHRQGQTRPVIIHHLITQGTADEAVIKALDGKEEEQTVLMDAIKALVAKYRPTK